MFPGNVFAGNVSGNAEREAGVCAITRAKGCGKGSVDACKKLVDAVCVGAGGGVWSTLAM